MFSTAQTDVLTSLIPVMRRQGYKYYVAYTNTSTTNSWSTPAIVDLYVIFSQEEITANNQYSYSVPAGAVRYSIRTSNYSTSDYGVNTARLVSSNYSGTLSINVYEHIYTNATFSSSAVQPDILFSAQGGYLYESSVSLNILTACLLLFIAFRAIIRISVKR